MTAALTDKGVQNKEEVIRLIFAYINQMKLNDGPPKYISDEKGQMRDIDFQFIQRSGALSYSKTRAT